MRKFFLILSFLLLFIAFFPPDKALACTITFTPEPTKIGDSTTVTFSDWNGPPWGLTYAIKYFSNGVTTGTQALTPTSQANAFVTNITFGREELWGVSVIDSAGNPECQTLRRITTRGFNPGSGVPPPKNWLPLINPGFGPSTAEGSGYFTSKLIPFIISLALFLILVLSLVFLIIGGIKYMTSGGNKEGAVKAKNTITYALIGLALGLGAFVIVQTLFSIFNVP